MAYSENNEIRSIDLSGVVMHRLKMLNLSKNHLEMIVGLNNSSFPNLEILNLSDNYLEALDFNGCRIPSIEQFVFSNNLELRTVRLGEMYLPKLRNILACNPTAYLRQQRSIRRDESAGRLPPPHRPQQAQQMIQLHSLPRLLQILCASFIISQFE